MSWVLLFHSLILLRNMGYIKRKERDFGRLKIVTRKFTCMRMCAFVFTLDGCMIHHYHYYYRLTFCNLCFLLLSIHILLTFHLHLLLLPSIISLYPYCNHYSSYHRYEVKHSYPPLSMDHTMELFSPQIELKPRHFNGVGR